MNNQNDQDQKASGQQQDQQSQQRMREQQQQRQGGGGGKADLSQIKEHMEVVGSDGAKVGTVDKVEGDRIKLTKDSSDGGEHRYIDAGMVASIEGNNVKLSTVGQDAVS